MNQFNILIAKRHLLDVIAAVREVADCCLATMQLQAASMPPAEQAAYLELAARNRATIDSSLAQVSANLE
jgi:hypothetical protein